MPDQPRTRSEWLDLLHRCQDGEASCLYVLKAIEAERDEDVEEIKRLRAALQPFATYADRRDAKLLAGLGDSVHVIHTGTEWEAEITLTDCRRAAEVLRGS